MLLAERSEKARAGQSERTSAAHAAPASAQSLRAQVGALERGPAQSRPRGPGDRDRLGRGRVWRRPTRRWQRRAGGSAKSIAAICPRICRARRSSSSQRAKTLPLLWGRSARHRRGSLRAARQDPSQVPGDRDAATKVRLPDAASGPAPMTRPASSRRRLRARLIEGGLPTEALVADVVVSKYAWHLPLYRQAQMMAAEGIDYRSLDARPLGRLRGLRAEARLRPAGRDPEELDQALRRRDAMPGARSGARQDQDRLSVGHRAR